MFTESCIRLKLIIFILIIVPKAIKKFNINFHVILKIFKVAILFLRRKTMQIFLLIVIFILIVINLKQADELRDLERKTLDAFKIVCKKLKQNTEER